MPRHTQEVRNRQGDLSPATLRHWGPLIAVEVHLLDADIRDFRRRGDTAPLPVRGLAIIDTGAAKTGIVPSVARTLGLITLGTAPVLTASGQTVQQAVHPAVVRFSDLGGFRAPIDNVVAMPMAENYAYEGQPIICLIGRDALVDASFLYEGAAARWTLSFPDT